MVVLSFGYFVHSGGGGGGGGGGQSQTWVSMLRHRKREISWENGKFPGKTEILEMKKFLSEQNRLF